MTELEFIVNGANQAALEVAAAEQIDAFLDDSRDLWEVESLASWVESELQMMGATAPILYRARYIVRLQPKLPF